MQQLIKKYSGKAILIFLLVCAAVLRFKKLGLESLWLDELHTMLESSPSWSVQKLFDYLTCCDVHPPLFYLTEKVMFMLFGYTEYVARVLPAIIGIACVWAMYKLGKEILNERLGLVAAAITCFNYFNIYYSQEARDYIVVWFLAILSFTYFIKLAKRLKRIDAIWYVISTTLLIYTHYYGILVIFSQLLIFLVLIAGEEKSKRKKFFVTFLVAELAILVLYLPWLSHLLQLSAVTTFWIAYPSQDFYYTYLQEYFGNSDYLLPFLYISLITYCVHVFTRKEQFTDIKNTPALLSFVFIMISVVVPYLLLYMRSVIVVPMMISRYTTVVLPALILGIAYGITLIENNFIRNSIIALFSFLSVFHIIYVKEYYRDISKTQFREMTAYVTNENPRAPIINEITAWQQQYYLDLFGNKARVFSQDKEGTVDAILAKESEDYNIDTFWIVGAHGDPHLEAYKKEQLDTAFVMIKNMEFKDAWAELYARRQPTAPQQDTTSTQ